MWPNIGRFFSNGNKSNNDISPCILFIDDSELQRKLIEKNLTRGNYRVLLSHNGELGLKLAKEKKPDLILLDIMMPGINGLEVCRRLKSDEETKNIPVLFFTEVDTPKEIIDCYEFGAENYIYKSIGRRELLSQIHMTLQDANSEKRD